MSTRPTDEGLALSVEVVVFGVDDSDLKLLARRREGEPFAGRWALPGGLVGGDEALEGAARRVLAEAGGVSPAYLEQLYTFGAIDRDPRRRTVSVAYYGLVRLADPRAPASAPEGGAAWFVASAAPRLALDHDEIAATARRRLQAKVRYEPIGFELLPRKFTLSQLQALYEVILERALDKRNFRKKILAMDLLADSGKVEADVARRPARLYRFDERRYRRLCKQGFNFEV
ncbi:MAG: NUDIX domain-containing protein [Nannocystaceae bacterium]